MDNLGEMNKFLEMYNNKTEGLENKRIKILIDKSQILKLKMLFKNFQKTNIQDLMAS